MSIVPACLLEKFRAPILQALCGLTESKERKYKDVDFLNLTFHLSKIILVRHTIWNENEVEVPSNVINHGFFIIIQFFESFTCFGLIGPSSEGAWVTANIPRSASHNKPNSPCFAVVHVGIVYIN
jgi:hypothetical protein